jgi:TorA maturation chaperone TorD
LVRSWYETISLPSGASASYYLTGFLHEKPLARLRDDMARLGIARQETVKEPEDHIAALFEMMAGLIVGEFGAVASLEDQKQFFTTHVGSWAKHFFKDLEGAKASVLYAALASAGRIFMDIEEMAFTMD